MNLVTGESQMEKPDEDDDEEDEDEGDVGTDEQGKDERDEKAAPEDAPGAGGGDWNSSHLKNGDRGEK